MFTSETLFWTPFFIVWTALIPSTTACSLTLALVRKPRMTPFCFSATSVTKSYLCSWWSTMVQSRHMVFWQVLQNNFRVSPLCLEQSIGLARALEPSFFTSIRDKIWWFLVALILLCAVTQNSHMKTLQSEQRETAESPLSQCSQFIGRPVDDALSCMLNKVMKLFTQKFGCSLLASPSGTYELKHTGLEQYSAKPLMELPNNNHYNILYKYGCLLALFPRKIWF